MVTHTEEEPVMNTVMGMVGDSSWVVTYTEEEPFNNTINGVVGA